VVAVPPKIQTSLIIDQALTQNVWYDVFTVNSLPSPQRNVRVAQIVFDQTVANEDLEVRITDDAGVATSVSQTAVVGTKYWVILGNSTGTAASRYVVSNAQREFGGFLFESRVVKIEIRKTTAAGANNTRLRLDWAKW